ncbi:MAG TPA: hypothetical protein EYN06_00770 [Myxococcales bacterium]|nr:hypothetical protein [Myxococcales bacterium]HIN84981.1 hypothetical protein [Myxococcales bacterium]
MRKLFLGIIVVVGSLMVLAPNVFATDRKALINELTQEIAAAAGQGDSAEVVISTPVESIKVAGVTAKPITSSQRAKRLLGRPAKKLKGTVGVKAHDTSSGYIAVGAALLLLTGVGLWLKKRANSSVGNNKGGTIETIATARVAGKHVISLVRVPGRILVVGMGEKGLSLLTEIDDSEMEKSTGTGGTGGGSGGFINRLAEQGFSGSPAGGMNAAPEASPFLSEADNSQAAVDELLRERTSGHDPSGERNAIRDRLRMLREKSLLGFNARA